MRWYSLIFSVFTALVLISAGGLQPIFAQSFHSGGNPVLSQGSQPVIKTQLARPHLEQSENIQNAHIRRTLVLQTPHLQLRLFRHNMQLVDRFMQTDPLQYKDSMNMYQSFGMNPINFVDPYGEAVRPGIDPRVAKSAYVQFIKSGDSPDTAISKLEKYGYIDSEPIYQLALMTSTHVEPAAEVLGTTAYIMFEFSPAGIFKDAVSLPGGIDVVSGQKLAWWQKALIVAPMAIKTASVVKTAAKGGVKALSASKYATNSAKYVEDGLMLNSNKLRTVTGMGDEALDFANSKVKMSDHVRKLYRRGKYREALDVHYEDLVRKKTGGVSQIINGREIDIVTDSALIQVKRSLSAVEKPHNFLSKATKKQILNTIHAANELGKRAEFWFKYGVHPRVRRHIESRGGIVKIGFGN